MDKSDDASLINRFTIPAIVRYEISCMPISPGIIVLLSEWGVYKNKGNNVLVWSDDLDGCRWTTKAHVLRLEDYLRRQPKKYFWVLMVRDSAEGCLSFLSDAELCKDGLIPFRFESEGELRYFVKMKKIDTTRYIIGEFKKWN